MWMPHYIIGFFEVGKVIFMLSNYDLGVLDIYFFGVELKKMFFFLLK